MSMRTHLLGFAFASADLLVEVNSGAVTMAIGSGPSAGMGPEAFQGKTLASLLTGEGAASAIAALQALKPGGRSGPFEVTIVCPGDELRCATLSAFAMPDLAPSLSCSIRYVGPAFSQALEAPPVLDAVDFLARANATMEGPGCSTMVVSFVDVVGLAALDAGSRAMARVEAALQAATVDGASAARLSPERYALLRELSDRRDLSVDIVEVASDEGVQLTVSSSDVALSADTRLDALRALRFAVEACLRDDALTDPTQAFDAALARTIRETSAFRVMVRDRSFALHYQPIVDLNTGAVHHYEALSRFVGQTNPADVIRMAEEMALIEGFDLAVAEKAIQRLRQPGSGLIRIAVNISGSSLANDTYVNALLRMSSPVPEERRRLIVEVTETAAVADVAAANRRLSALRKTGIRVCIDDFGAGSASLDYLRGLSVDTVKIDGKFIRGLEGDPRARMLVAHLVELCGSLKLSTIAEFVETQACADILRDLGVDHGQGWLFGKAAAELSVPVSAAARRRGAVESWG